MNPDINTDNLKIGYSKASYICSRRECCESDIYTKLLQWKLNPQEAALVLSQLVNEHFIDNERYTFAYVRDKSKFSAWGAMKIKMALRAKKIDNDLIQAALANLPDDQFYQQALKEAIKKNRTLAKDDLYSQKQKLARYLFAKGFESDIVWKIVAVVTSSENEDVDLV